jgi:uncharacterized protein GlcG (DUF336 family)
MSVVVCAVVLVGTLAQAQQPLPAGVPEKMPFDIPYGTTINLERATQLIAAAAAEAKRHDWKLAIAVVDPNGDLVAFNKMDGTQLASVKISQGKAITAARFRRESRVFFNAMETGHPYVESLDPTLIASPGGFPLVEGGKLIGAIGCSGGTGDQDAVACKAAADTVK